MASNSNQDLWDNTRCDLSNHDIDTPLGLLKLAKTIRDFMDLVHAEHTGLTQVHCNDFAVFLDHDVSWSTAERLVPEFRKSYTDADLAIMRGPLRLILQSLMEKNRIHRPPKYTALNREQTILRRQLEQEVAFVEAMGRDIKRAPKQDRDISRLNARRIESIIERGEVLDFDKCDEVATPIFFEDQLVAFEYHKTWYEVKPTARDDILSLEDRSREQGLPVVVKVPGGAGVQPMTNLADGTVQPFRPQSILKSSSTSDLHDSQAP